MSFGSGGSGGELAIAESFNGLFYTTLRASIDPKLQRRFVGAVVNSWRGLLIALSCLALRLVAIWIYRLTFHPLAKYPGPWLAKVSDLYGAYYNARRQLHIETEKGHRRWGPLIRQGPDKLVFNSATALHDVYSSNEVQQKSYGYTTMIPAPGAYNISTAVDKGIHKHKRKVLSQGFSD
ncbi:MAG: benzoate 4-monooxygenase cytochrome P450 [Lasallia pustulata]|uniref:Benzoate 4-monooxygenase cytochrome P450 n=1 Tax=Lasallia pustulata TaxID=136370 RepID=A0A5M8Q170_9LECA|nr:MAG: benzoate 4-monooxygenase cytochrome P450 [Lasallia pustulata]